MRSKLLLLAAVTLVGCSEDETTPPVVEDAQAETFGIDARVDSTSPTDSGGADTAMDSTATDSGTTDSATTDSATTDSATTDSGTTDTRTDVAVDSATDTSVTDTAVADAIDSAIDATDTAVTDAASDATFAAAPTCDGTIAAGEYGVHVEGSNQYSNVATTTTTTWYMTWDDTSLYLAVQNADVGEAVVVYVDANVLAPPTGGTNADGNLSGQAYDSTNLATLPFRANLVAYAKSSYREYRTANGSGGWSDATTSFGCFASSGTNRELSIPWSALGGRPASFGVLGYVTSSAGHVYGEIPVANPDGTIGTASVATRFFLVGATGPAATPTAFATER